ncbi:MAG: SanA/YdcF family protein [Bacteroidia bacterium]
MNALRLIIVLLLFLSLVYLIWLLQKYKSIKLITRFFVIPFFLLLITAIFISNYLVEKAAKDKVYSDVNLIPARETALVLGVYKDRAPEFFNKRIDAAVILYEAGKAKKFIVSGADGPDNYDEAADMKAALIEKGVPDSLITMDKNGDHTINSIINSKEVFHKDKIIVVSQSYHVARAIYTASKHNVDAIGFYSGTVGVITPPKELASRIKAVFFQ